MVTTARWLWTLPWVTLPGTECSPWVTPARCRCSALTRDVQMTSRRLMFIQLSQLTRCPLYVSPFFSSTSYDRTAVTGRRSSAGTGMCPVSPARYRVRGEGLGRAAGTHHGVVLRRFQQGQGQLRGEERRKASGTDRQRDTGLGTPARASSGAPGTPSLAGW